MKRKLLVIGIVVAFLLPSATIDFKNISKKHDFETAIPKEINLKELISKEIKTVDNPQEVAIVVDIKRVRSLCMHNQSVYFKVLINGNNSIWWYQTFKGMDIWFEWPMAYNIVKYDEGKEIPIQIELWRKGIIDEPCDISKQNGEYLYGKTLTIFYNLLLLLKYKCYCLRREFLVYWLQDASKPAGGFDF